MALEGLPEPASEESVEFLRRYVGDEPIVLTSILPDVGGTDSITLKPVSDAARLLAWIAARQGRRNIYFTVNGCNRAIQGMGTGSKAAKIDIDVVRAIHVDVDAYGGGETIEESKARAMRFFEADTTPGPPSIIIDSGNGLQGFWLLEPRISLVEDPQALALAEGVNLKKALDCDSADQGTKGDSCQDVSRIMRLPGTINLPTAKKRAKGRVPVLAKLILFDEARRYPIAAFPAVNAPQRSSASAAAPSNVVEFKTIPEHVELEALVRIPDTLREIIRHGLDPREPTRFTSRSEVVYHVVSQLFMASVAREEITSILIDRNYAVSESFLEHGRGARAMAMRQVARIAPKVGIVGKPQVEVRIGNITEVLDRAERALIDDDVEMFQRYGALVRVTRENDLALRGVECHWLLEKMIDAATWVKPGAKGELRHFDPKLEMAHHYMARHGQWKIPHVKAVIATPTLRRDMSILAAAGYDEASSLFYDPGNVKFPTLPEEPTQEQARAALDLLLEPLRCFPFVPEDVAADWVPDKEEGRKPSPSRSVILSAILSGLIRASLSSLPMHLIDAPEKGTGKSRLADFISIIITGRTPSMLSFSGNEVEDKKALFSALMASPRIIVYDNIERPIEGAHLCTIMTQEVWQDRVLGVSEMASVPTNVLFIGTGNNITCRGDMTRRQVVCHMDARSEHPDQRDFDFDPRTIAFEQRTELVIAALTVLRAYHAAGRPCPVRPVGSFEDWTFVREALVWLGEPDPALTRRSILEEDPQRSQSTEVMIAWERCFGSQEKQLLTLMSEIETNMVSDELMRLLSMALSSVCPNNRLAFRGVDQWFRRNSGKVIAGKRFLRGDDAKMGVLVKLEGAADGEPEWVDEF